MSTRWGYLMSLNILAGVLGATTYFVSANNSDTLQGATNKEREGEKK